MVAAILNKWYPFYFWFLSNVIASVLLFILSLTSSTASGIQPDALFGFFLMLSIGLLYSTPAGLLCFVVYRSAILKLHVPAVKTLVCIVAITGTLITLLSLWGAKAFDWRKDPSGLELLLTYSISIILSSTFLKMYKKSRPIT
jgi:hypothetical protein